MSSIVNENVQYTDPSTGELLVNGYIYIGTDGLDAKLNPVTIYSDRDLTTVLANPQRTGADGRSVNKIWVPGRYSMKVENSSNVQKLNDLSMGDVGQSGNTTLVNVIGVDNITAEASPTITALIDKQAYIFTSAGANTGAMTLGIDLTPALPIMRRQSEALIANDIRNNQMVMVIYNEAANVYELVSTTGNEVIPGRIDVANRVSISGTSIELTDVPINESQGSDLASAATTDIGSATGNYVNITGTTTITGLGTIQAGTRRIVQFSGALTLTHNGISLILPGNSNILTAAGNTAEFVSLGSGNWICVNYQRSISYRGAMAYKNSSQTITDSTWTPLTFPTEDHDTDNFHSTAINIGRLSIPAGVNSVRIDARVTFTSNAVGSRQIRFRRNGAAMLQGSFASLNGSAVPAAMTLSISSPPINVFSTDYFEVEAYQTSGADLDVVGWTAGITSFSLQFLG